MQFFRNSIFCFEQAGISLADTDFVDTNSDSNMHLWRKIIHSLQYRPKLSMIMEKLDAHCKMKLVEQLLESILPGDTFV